MPRRLFCLSGKKARKQMRNAEWNADYERRTVKRGLFGTDLAAFSEYAERPARSIQSRSGNTGGGPAGPGCLCCRLAWFCAKVDRKSPGAHVSREKAARGAASCKRAVPAGRNWTGQPAITTCSPSILQPRSRRYLKIGSGLTSCEPGGM